MDHFPGQDRRIEGADSRRRRRSDAGLRVSKTRLLDSGFVSPASEQQERDGHARVDELLSDPQEVVSEREAFLLRELQAMFVREKLIASASDVVVVPARDAWPEYEKYHAYVCQPARPFQSVSRIAFYSHGRIHPLVPKILRVEEEVVFDASKHEKKLQRLIDVLLEETPREEGKAYKVMFLSPPDSADTVDLKASIPNDLVSESGRTTAFTQNQRYASLERLKNARTTSDLVDPRP